MSTDSLAEFHRMLMANPELQDQLRGIADGTSFVAKVVALGATHGFHFTPEEVRAEISRAGVSNGNLSDEQLAAVSGGVGQLAGKDYGVGASPSVQLINPQRTGI